MSAVLMLGDCLERMAEIPDGSVDMVMADLPYGTTQNKWDSVIPLEDLWTQWMRVAKNNAAFVFTATQPFSSVLGASKIEFLRYSWTWIKPHTGQLNAKRMPLKNVEDVLIFYRTQPTYNPQFTAGKPYVIKRVNYTGNESYGAQKDHDTISDGKRYPKQVLEFYERNFVHPTQKPVALMEYLVRTYTNEGQTVLDNTMGSGTTGVACANSGRNFIGIERDEKYFAIAQNRIAQAKGKKP